MTPLRSGFNSVIIDYEYKDDILIGVHHFILDDNAVLNDSPDGSQTITPMQLIARMNGDPELQRTNGWHVVKQHSGETKPLTRWQRLLAHTASPEGHPQLKAMRLFDGDKQSEALTTQDDGTGNGLDGVGPATGSTETTTTSTSQVPDSSRGVQWGI